MPKKLIGVNEEGRRVGQYHPAAKLTDREVQLLLRLHDEENWGCRRLAKKFDLSVSQVKRILRGKHRCQWYEKFKVVEA